MKTRKILLIILSLALVLLSGCRDEVRSAPYFDKLISRISAGDPPDVGFMDSLRAAEYLDQGLLKEIPADLVDQGDFYPALLPYFQRDGRTYALPRDFQTVALLVNVDLFRQAGASLPYEWDGFMAAAEQITALGGDIRGVGLTSGHFNFAPFLLQADRAPYKEDGTLNLQTDAGRTALTYYADLYWKGYASYQQGDWPYMGVYDPGGLIDQFVAGKIGMFLVGPSMYQQAVQRASGAFEMQLIELPAGPAGKATIAYVVGFGLFSEPTEASIQLLQYAVSQEGMQIWFDPAAAGLNPPSAAPAIYLPARRSLREAWNAAHPDAKAFMDGIDYLPYFPILNMPFPDMTEFDQQAASIIGDVLNGYLPVDDALAKMEEAGNAVINK